MKIITVRIENDKDAETLKKVLSETKFTDKIETYEEDEITDDELRILEDRYEAYLKNPSSGISLDDFKKKSNRSMVFRITLQSAAKEELKEVIEYYYKISPELAEDVTNQFYSSLKLISETPNSFQIIRGQYRKVNLQRFPYKIIYRVREEEVTVIAIAHQKRRPFYWRGR